MTAVILQPSYIPWRGYFHQVRRADVFVFYDDVPYDRRGWRNRNRIKWPGGPRWLTIPVLARGSRLDLTPIREIRIDRAQPWARTHRETLRHAYGKTPHFEAYRGLVEGLYARDDEFLADFTIASTIALAGALGIDRTRFVRSSDLPAEGRKTGRLLSVLAALGASHYLTGPSARAYIEEEAFRRAGIALEYMSYDYPEYPQLHPPFDPHVSILDLLFMAGPGAPAFIWGEPA